jgi:hypothetical protein
MTRGKHHTNKHKKKPNVTLSEKYTFTMISCITIDPLAVNKIKGSTLFASKENIMLLQERFPVVSESKAPMEEEVE